MKQMIRTTILSAAVGAVPLLGLASAASAQYRVNTGNVLDANTRMGSGGVNPNDSQNRAPESITGNDIVTGNVTGGRHFRGSVPYTDPRAFRANTSDRNVDNFVRQSSGPDSRLAETVQPFYGSGRAVAPPAGFVPVDPGSGAYLAAGTTVTRASGDMRLGDLNLANPQVALPQPGQLVLPGQVDPSAGQMYITASPLYGIRQFGPNDPALMGTTNTQFNPVTNQLDTQSIDRMRMEMLQGLPPAPDAGLSQPGGSGGTGGTNDATNATGATTGGAAGGAAGAAGGQRASATPVAGATPINQQPVQQAQGGAQQPINTAIVQNAGDLSTQQGVRNRLTVPPPQQQSSVYAELYRRHQEAASNQALSDEEANRQFTALQRQQQQQRPGQPGQPGQPAQGQAATPGQAGAPGAPGALGAGPVQGAAAPGASSGTAGAPGAPGAGAAQGQGAGGAASAVPDYAKRGEEILKGNNRQQPKTARKADPVKVPSLSQGVKGKGLAEIMKSAEDDMKQGKFTRALDQYDKADQVAPNNPLIKLGRAQAELGAAYYARAESHLREVLSNNPELLVGQYDLANMLGEQRLQVLVRDLKEIAKNDAKEARPLFLLAYIAYNTGHAQNAEAYVDLADKRSGGTDNFYKLLRDNWALPGGTAGAASGATTQPSPNK
ncbi:MAG TPA: tetratricopeptide repeat protein [Tepidisphaeraceae bacterium]|nr:tetratricopeptide repeat protein [Tepidisphaeraceae bacterium]